MMLLGSTIFLVSALAASLADDATFAEGVRLYEQTNYEQAIFRFEEVAVRRGIAPADKATALVWLGLSYAGTGDLDGAKRMFRDAIVTDVTVAAPASTSPRILELLEEVRAQVAQEKRDAPEALDAPSAGAGASGGAGTTPPPSTPADGGAAMFIGGIVAVGAGAAAFIGSGAFALVAADQLKTANDPNAFQDDAKAAADAAGASATASLVLVSVAAVLAGAGGALLLLE